MMTRPQRATSRGEIFVVDDDAAMREILSTVLQGEGYDVICFADGAALLSLARTRIPSCIFLEVRSPERAGLELLRKLRLQDYPAPIFVVSGQGDIPMAVDAIRSGASDFIETRCNGSETADRIRAVIATLSQLKDEIGVSKISSLHLPGREPLTRRERDVLAYLADGATNKEAALRLGLSARTIEGHRANIMRKVGAMNAAVLVRRILSERDNPSTRWGGLAEAREA